MRRIPLALALVAAVALTGCTGGSKSSATTGSDVQKGVTGQYFYVNLHQPPVGGTITSSTGGINCGASSVSVDSTVNPPQYHYVYISNLCGDANGQTSFPWFQADGVTLTTVTLTATPATGNAFIGWAGDCSGTSATCTLTAGADKTVVAIFGAPGSGHGFPFPGTVHGPALKSGTLDCFKCHGNVGQGQSIAPACSTCHADRYRSGTGLAFAVTSVTSTTSNIVVTFTVKDDKGANVDLTGADGKNRPFVPRFGLASFAKNATTGIVGPYVVRTAGNADSGGPGVLTPPAVGAPASATTGELTGTPGSYTYTFPPAVTFDPATSADTHTIWMQGTRQEDLTASTTRTLTVRNYQFNFKPGALGVPVTTADAAPARGRLGRGLQRLSRRLPSQGHPDRWRVPRRRPRRRHLLRRLPQSGQHAGGSGERRRGAAQRPVDGNRGAVHPQHPRLRPDGAGRVGPLLREERRHLPPARRQLHRLPRLHRRAGHPVEDPADDRGLRLLPRR